MSNWDEQTDIVVVGSGLAGLCAAIEAAEAGASVLVLEKIEATGGNTRISDGGVAAPNNYLQREKGVEDSPERFSQDILRAGLGLNHPELVAVLAEQASEAMFAAGHPCVGIVDAVGANFDADSLHHCLKRGVVKGYGSLAGLAAAFGMPPGRLEETVKAYNRAVSGGGADPFGKPFTPETRPISRPPFYAVRLWPKVHYTSGGVGIDERARVLDVNGRPIPNLYAAGEVCGGVHGASRLGSCSLTECIVFGRIAGREAAA